MGVVTPPRAPPGRPLWRLRGRHALPHRLGPPHPEQGNSPGGCDGAQLLWRMIESYTRY